MKGPKYISSKEFDRFDREKNYKKHLQKLDSIKKKKNNVISEEMVILDNVKNLKIQNKKYMRNEKEENIQRDNHILLSHIVNISTKDTRKTPFGVQDRCQSSPGRSKKVYLKKMEEQRIKAENLCLAKKLIEVDENSNKEWENYMASFKKPAKMASKVQQGQESRGYLKTIDTNRRASSRIKLPPIEKDKLTMQSRTIEEENFEGSLDQMGKNYLTDGPKRSLAELNQRLDTYHTVGFESVNDTC